MKIVAEVKRGQHIGKLIYPHRNKEGMYAISLTRFEKDYIRVETLEEVAAYVAKGFKVRMSNPDDGIKAASLIEPGAICIGKNKS